MIGHNWGAEHAERWVWIQGADLGEDEPSYLDMAAGRIKVGPLTTPWVANGMLRIDGIEHRLGGFDRILSTKLDEEPTSCRFEISGKDVKLRGRVSSEPRNFVAWVYADPKGPEHNTLNCSISDLELEIEQAGREPQATRARRSGRLRDRDAPHRPRHPAPALPGRLTRAARSLRRRNRAQVLFRPSRAWSVGPVTLRAAARADDLGLDDPRRVSASSAP